MKNKNLMIKYYSGDVSEAEKNEFEIALRENSDLRAEYEDFISKLESLSEIKSIEIDERYFNSILPRVREKINVSSKSTIPKIAYSLSFAITIFIVLLITNRSGDWTDSDFYIISDSVIEQSSEDEIFTRLDSDLLYNPEYLSLTTELSTTGLLSDEMDYQENYPDENIPFWDDVQIEELNETESLQIYNELKNKKF